MRTLPLRLPPGADLRAAIEAAAAAHSSDAAFVIAGIGSLDVAQLRLAGARDATALRGDLEMLTLSGTVAAGGSHLHMSVADAGGRVTGGHVGRGCVVRTTAEVLLVFLPDWTLAREHDAATGFAELVVKPRG